MFVLNMLIDPDEYPSSESKAWLLNYQNNYVNSGGFPEIVLDDNEISRIRTLKEYIEVMMMRDIVERHGVKNIKILRMLYNGILASFSKEFSIHKFYKSLKSQGIKVSKNTL